MNSKPTAQNAPIQSSPLRTQQM